MNAQREVRSASKTRHRVLLVSSSGGHWTELRRLAPAFDQCERVWCSVLPEMRDEVAPDRFLRVPDANRWNKLRLLWSALCVVWVLLRVRPHVVVSTGAAPGFFAISFAKLVNARTVWIDSIANAEELSMSGRNAAQTATLTLTQWPELGTPLPSDPSARQPGEVYFAGSVV
jgi:UDP-N-acetylglucosamine:LPS N-acetylglucosamine transferase